MTEYTTEQWEAMPESLPQINSAEVPYELKQADANVWGRLVPAQDDETTKGAMGAIKDLFGRLAEAASIAQGDRKITNTYIDELEKINKKLKACLDILLDLIAQLEEKDTESQETLQQLQAKIHNAPNLDLIRKELEGLVALMGNVTVDRGKFRRELVTLVGEIKRLCEEGDRLKTNMERGSGGKVSEEDGGGGGGGNVSTTPSSTSAPIDLMGWTRSTDAQSGRPYYSCPGQDSRWDPPEGMCVPRTTTSAFSGSGGTDTPESVGRTDRGESLTQPRSSGDFGTPFNCADHPHARLGIDLRKDIIEKMISWARGSGREAAAKKLARYADQHLYTSPRCAHVLKSLGYSRGNVLAARLKSEMDRQMAKDDLLEARNRAWTSAASHEGGRRRRTRKKRAGWRTPEKGSPMRTLYTKENKKKKHTKKKKNKRKKRKKKGTRRRRNRKR